MEKKQNFFVKNKVFTIFAILGIIVILVAIFAPVVAGGVDPTKGVLKDALQGPSAEHIFGTDKLGRDVYARVIYGARVSLVAAFSVVALAFLIGSILGIVAGYFGKAVDAIIMRIADMMIAFRSRRSLMRMLKLSKPMLCSAFAVVPMSSTSAVQDDEPMMSMSH